MERRQLGPVNGRRQVEAQERGVESHEDAGGAQGQGHQARCHPDGQRPTEPTEPVGRVVSRVVGIGGPAGHVAGRVVISERLDLRVRGRRRLVRLHDPTVSNRAGNARTRINKNVIDDTAPRR